MEPPISPNPGASPFLYGPQDSRSPGKPEPHQRPRADAWAGSAPSAHTSHLARDIRATVDASRAGRLPGKGAKALKRGTRGLITVLALAMIVATIATSASLADKCAHGNNPQCPSPTGGGGGGTGGRGSLSLVMVTDANGDRQPNYGDTVTFNVSTTTTVYPYVMVNCSQGGVSVYSAYAGFYPSYPWPWDQDFNLSSSSWTGGGASCTAQLEYFTGKSWAVITSVAFDVAP